MSSRVGTTIAVSFATSLVTSAAVFAVLQLVVAPKLNRPKTPGTTQVPNVIGLKPSDATTILQQKHLLLKVVERSPNPKVRAGLIHSQEPLAGSVVRSGEYVLVKVSTGIPREKVPQVVGMTFQAAKTALEAKGFKVSGRGVERQDVPAHQVLSQKPAAGQNVVKGSVVELTFANPPSLVEIPKFKGQYFKRKKIEEELTKLGLKLGRVRRVDRADTGEGYIYSTKPDSGEKVAPGTEVNFVIQHYED